jgi:long-chain acyl-CoA synthetase
MWEKFTAENGRDVTQLNSRETENLLPRRIAALTSDLPNYGRVRRLYVTLDPWTAEAGQATVTMKLKRTRIEQYFQESIDAIYIRSRN